MKQKVEIELDVPDGYEATGEFRHPNEDERWVAANGTVSCGLIDINVFILRKKFVWPDWVKPGTWYTRDQSGREFLSMNEPSLQTTFWGITGQSHQNLNILRELIDVPPFPQTGDWRKSKMQKPLEAK